MQRPDTLWSRCEVDMDFDVSHDIDVAFYPDSGKIGVWGKGINRVYRADGNVDYYDGE